MKDWQREYGDPFTIKALNGTVVMTSSPQGIKDVFRASPDTYETFAPDVVRPLLGDKSVIVEDGAEHKRDRKLLTPPFHGERMRAYGHVIGEITQGRVRSDTPVGTVLHCNAVFRDISLLVILRAVFGVGQAETDEFREMVVEAIDAVHPSFIFIKALQRRFGGMGPYAKFVAKNEAYEARLDVWTDDLRAKLERGESDDSILAMMIAARYDDGSAMENDAIRAQLKTLVFAGHETTAITLAWAMEHLHRNPETLAKLRAELDGAPDLEPATTAKLPYLEAVCNESLRLYPIVTEVLRTLKKPLTVDGFDCPAGVAVSPSVMLAHRREEVFPDPESFRPERFIDKRYSPFEFLPFGGGHRRCLGAAFAMYEMKLVLADLIRRFEFEAVHPEPDVPVRRNVTMEPKSGVPMRVVKVR